MAHKYLTHLSVLVILVGHSGVNAQECIFDLSTGFDQGLGELIAERDFDDDWIVGAGPSGEADPVVVTSRDDLDAPVFPVPPWIPHQEGDTSRWISTTSSTDGGLNAADLPGDYTFEISFTLPAMLPNDAEHGQLRIVGAYGIDNSLVDIVINGLSTGEIDGNLGSFTPFDQEFGLGLLQAGTNAIEFIVNNADCDDNPGCPNPVGLRVDGCVVLPPAVPEDRPFNISTGFDETGNAPLGDGAADSSYNVTGPGELNASPVAIPGAALPAGWFPTNVNSRWVSPAADPTGVAGEYVYATTVNLPGGFDATLGILSGRFGGASGVTDIRVNGESVGISSLEVGSLKSFPSVAGQGLFQSGDNTVEFVVTQIVDGPTGLRVDGQILEGPPIVDLPASLFTLDTGFDNAAFTVIANGQPDDNWVISGPDVGRVAATVVPDNAFPIPPWLASTSQSKWIGTSAVSSDGPAGIYTFNIKVTIPDGYDAASASLIGGVSSDNAGVDVLVNGVSLGFGPTGNFPVLETIPDGTGLGLFVNGENTVEVLVDNASFGPVGLRVEAVVGTGVIDPDDLSTGISDRGIGPLPGGAEDGRYIVQPPGDEPPRAAIVVPEDGFPIPPWAANTITSQWIGVDGEDSEGAAGTYLYDISFELPSSFNPKRVVLVGQWAAAGSGSDVLVNGVPLGITTAGPSALTPFPADAGLGEFLLGTNTLTFVVENSAVGPTGLRVEARASMVVAPNPLDISTGFDQVAGEAIADGGGIVEDDDYLVTDSFDFQEQALVIADAERPGDWIENSMSSRWVGPTGALIANPGNFLYEVVVDLTAAQAAGATIVGFWAVDNGVVLTDDMQQIFINGVGVEAPVAVGFTAFSEFPPDLGLGLFAEGFNVIEFPVSNDGVDPNPTGLRVDAWINTPGQQDGVGPFLRGDCNADGQRNITDGVFQLNFLFLGGPRPACLAACDNDGSGDVPATPTDALVLFNFLFLGGPAPPGPVDDCGFSPREEDATIGCADTVGCSG